MKRPISHSRFFDFFDFRARRDDEFDAYAVRCKILPHTVNITMTFSRAAGHERGRAHTTTGTCRDGLTRVKEKCLSLR